MKFTYDDGGREAAGYKGKAGDCVVRAVSIASGRPYQEIYDLMASGAGNERKSRGKTARNGIHVSRLWFKRVMGSLGFVWTPTMGIGTGCKVHLAEGELPDGRLVVSISKHYTAVIDGEIRDTHNHQRATMFYENNQHVRTAQRCVYGYWKLTTA